ncbi:MAG: type IX secretion system protein PorG [Polaribacter sp.]
MRNHIIVIVFLSFSSVLLGQMYEIGVSLGSTNYVGDVGRTNYIYPNKFAGAIFLKYNLNPRMALRGTYSYLPIKADDRNADTYFRQDRNFNFTNTIHELAVGLEYNFYEYDLSSEDKNWTPYILIELAGFRYKTIIEEPQPGVYKYGNESSYAIPFGVGFKSKLYGALAFSIETKIRYTFKDDLDYTTDKIPSLDYGGTGNDWYMFTGVSFIYTFGRPACYTNGL